MGFQIQRSDALSPDFLLFEWSAKGARGSGSRSKARALAGVERAGANGAAAGMAARGMAAYSCSYIIYGTVGIVVVVVVGAVVWHGGSGCGQVYTVYSGGDQESGSSGVAPGFLSPPHNPPPPQ